MLVEPPSVAITPDCPDDIEDTSEEDLRSIETNLLSQGDLPAITLQQFATAFKSLGISAQPIYICTGDCSSSTTTLPNGTADPVKGPTTDPLLVAIVVVAILVIALVLLALLFTFLIWRCQKHYSPW